jgi:Fe-S-cluster containining protein
MNQFKNGIICRDLEESVISQIIFSMSLLPEVAARTFKKLGQLKEFRNIHKMITKKLSRLSSPIERAKFAHKKVEQYNEEVFSDPIVKENISCKKGCSACCHTQVSATQDEAILLADLIKKGHKIDWTRFHKQKQVGNSHADWYKLSHADRGCIFLDSEKGCSIYEHRPLVCRTNNVISSTKNCDTTLINTPTINLINTFKSDMVTHAAFSKSNGGVMPKIVWEALERENQVPLIYHSRQPLKNP